MTVVHNLLLFIFSLILFTPIVSGSASAQTGNGGERAVAVVNGVRIPYRFFENERVNQMARMGVAPDDSTAMDQLAEDGVFLTVVDSELTLQEGKRRGIVISEEEAIELLISTPPSYVRDIFAGQAYRPSTLRELIRDPEKIRPYIVDDSGGVDNRVAQWKELTDALVRYYRVDETRRRLVDSLYDAAPLSANQILHRYIAESSILSGSVVRILHSTIPESETPVSEEEARKWFSDHIDEYVLPESRRPLTIILKVIPAPADSALQRRAIESARDRILAAPAGRRTAVVDAALKDLPANRIPSDEYISPNRFGGTIMNDLAGASSGDLLGPYPTEGETLMLYVAATRPSSDTLVRARHILLNSDVVVDADQRDRVSAEEIDAAIRGLAADLMDSIRTEEDFARIARDFSQDFGSASDGGDLGYAERGRYVPSFDSAVFDGPVGELQGLIRTQFGYHLIWVSDRAAREFQLRELRFPIEPSDSIRRAVARDAAAFADRLRSGESPAQIIGEIRSSYPGVVVDSLTFLKRLEPYADGLTIGEFLFRSDQGEVGVVPLPFDRVAIVQVIAIWPGGVPRFEEIEAYPYAHARREMQLDILEERHQDLAQKITPESLLGPLREQAADAEVFLLQEEPISVMDDEDPWMLDSLVAVTDAGEVSGPVRGRHGLYLLRLKEKIAPDQAQTDRDFPGYREQFVQQYRRDLFEKVLSEARANATIVDLRESTARLLGSADDR